MTTPCLPYLMPKSTTLKNRWTLTCWISIRECSINTNLQHLLLPIETESKLVVPIAKISTINKKLKSRQNYRQSQVKVALWLHNGWTTLVSRQLFQKKKVQLKSQQVRSGKSCSKREQGLFPSKDLVGIKLILSNNSKTSKEITATSQVLSLLAEAKVWQSDQVLLNLTKSLKTQASLAPEILLNKELPRMGLLYNIRGFTAK